MTEEVRKYNPKGNAYFNTPKPVFKLKPLKNLKAEVAKKAKVGVSLSGLK